MAQYILLFIILLPGCAYVAMVYFSDSMDLDISQHALKGIGLKNMVDDYVHLAWLSDWKFNNEVSKISNFHFLECMLMSFMWAGIVFGCTCCFVMEAICLVFVKSDKKDKDDKE